MFKLIDSDRKLRAITDNETISLGYIRLSTMGIVLSN